MTKRWRPTVSEDVGSKNVTQLSIRVVIEKSRLQVLESHTTSESRRRAQCRAECRAETSAEAEANAEADTKTEREAEREKPAVFSAMSEKKKTR